jgi:hypothetical protein
MALVPGPAGFWDDPSHPAPCASRKAAEHHFGRCVFAKRMHAAMS